jgi:small-conductance mechanosensitive channel
MRVSLRALLLLLLGSLSGTSTAPGESQATAPAQEKRVSPLTAEQLVQILDETVDWYRTLGTQQQSATQPSDLLLLYANRQIADKVMGLAFQIARANAELLSSEASSAEATGAAAHSPQALDQLQRNSTQRVEGLEKEMDSVRGALATAPESKKSDLAAKLAELQGELAMVKAQKNSFDAMAQFVYENDPKRAGVSALKARIDAVAATIPAASAPAAATTAGTAPVTSPAATAPQVSTVSGAVPRELGIWDLFRAALRLSQKMATIDTVGQRTLALQGTFLKIRTAPKEQLKRLSARSDELAAAADRANGAALKGLRDQFDTLAWLFTQTSAIALPLSQETVLLTQYRENLAHWRAAVERQYGEVFASLRTRLAILLGALVTVFIGSEVARRTVLKYVQEPRRRNQLLLLRKIVTWMLVLLILGLTFITQLSAFATFAGLLTAGLAVAMQSVLVSVVGYFVLIGKYGVRVGDRVQIGAVTGEVIDLGLIRMHLLELTSQGPLGPTGRVVAFANSIVFQASSGLFRQIPGVNFIWHELTLPVPAGSDYLALKGRLLATLAPIVDSYRGEIVRQAESIKKTRFSTAATDMTPQVQLQFSQVGVEAKVRYPVPLNRAAEVDERVSEELHLLVQRRGATETT